MKTPHNEDEIVERVNQYVEKHAGLKGSLTMQTRRVIAALKAIGLPRSQFTARTHIDRGVYGPAVGDIQTHSGCALVIANAELLVRCGLTVHIFEHRPGIESAFVATPVYGEPRIVRHASLVARSKDCSKSANLL